MQKEQQEVNAIPRQELEANVEVITVTVDSGAYHTVGPPRIGTHFPIKATESSRAGKTTALLMAQS